MNVIRYRFGDREDGCIMALPAGTDPKDGAALASIAAAYELGAADGALDDPDCWPIPVFVIHDDGGETSYNVDMEWGPRFSAEQDTYDEQ